MGELKSIGTCIKCGWEIWQEVLPKPVEQPLEPVPIGPKEHVVWVDKFTGKEKTTKFSGSGDNPQFKRFGAVAFGYWPGSDRAYVYNTKYVNSGEGHVEYHPELNGQYEITWYYRETRNRSKKPCDVRLVTPDSTKLLKAVYQYSEESDYKSIRIGTVDLTKSDYINVVPGDRKSMSFGKMKFTRVDTP